MSEVSCAITTASGGCAASQVVVWACWSRTACEVISRLPNRAASAASVLASACGSGRFKLLAVAIPKRYPPGVRPTLAKDIWGVKRPWIEPKGIADDDAWRRRRCAAAARALPCVGDADRAA